MHILEKRERRRRERLEGLLCKVQGRGRNGGGERGVRGGHWVWGEGGKGYTLTLGGAHSLEGMAGTVLCIIPTTQILDPDKGGGKEGRGGEKRGGELLKSQGLKQKEESSYPPLTSPRGRQCSGQH
jgi:hypothetical protein